MPLTMRVDTDQWRDHLTTFVGEHTGIVPVAKGNGYGFGIGVLAAEAAKLGVPTLAVGTYEEVDAAEPFGGDVLVLSPWHADAPTGRRRLVHTVSRLEDLRALAGRDDRPKVVVEVMTGMRRHGIDPADIPTAAALIEDVDLAGWALHLPMAGDRLGEARRLGRAVVDAGGNQDGSPALWVSHLDPADVARLSTELSADVRLRVGTALWLGTRSALRATATVLDVHDLERGDTFGYRQRRARRAGRLVVVAGGTAHGIALEAPTAATTVRQRAIAAAKGGLEATGRALSPFRIGGKQRWFAEPPHMQCSLIWLPAGVDPPAIGDEVDVDVRYTTTSFDAIDWS